MKLTWVMAFAAGLGWHGVNAATKVYNFTISSKTIAPDGFSRDGLVINGQYPGPTITVNTGDTIQVNVINNLTVPTALHWHGMYQRGTPWQDGTPGVTQCPIPAGGKYTYSFSTAGQSGTYWYHSHYMSQYVDGLVGALIIQDPSATSPLPYDEEIVIPLSDWYHTQSEDLLEHYLSRASKGEEPSPDNALIGGTGSNGCAGYVPPGTSCNANHTTKSFSFTAGKRYKLRLINTSAFANFWFSIDNHTLAVVEADGTDLTPQYVHRIPINVGQRYSVIVQANQKAQKYYMRAQMDTACLDLGEVIAKESLALAPVIYKGGASTFNSSVDWADQLVDCQDLDYTVLRPYHAQVAPTAAEQITLSWDFHGDPVTNINRAFINNVSWVANFSYPTMINEYYKRPDLSQDQLMIRPNTSGYVEVVLINNDLNEHPFHLHGHTFYVLGWGNETYDDATDRPKFNTKNPLRRDTSTVPGGGWTVFRYKADNTGVWALHCHIEWHVEAGLLVQLVDQSWKIPQLNISHDALALCAASNYSHPLGTSKTTLTSLKNAHRKRSVTIGRRML
ncbi:hypothetical protein INT44_004881 [Umbelopsis vinacea]|uniref:Laccase n=1 Tax=Umbelopsis vinacea TaxID=44442 RepID=A0A8H7UQH1_9FUNG|nr:hypothetical protein INT44_004881 [Umbelopsis vinacea]